ncbi:hypothetical protein ACWCRC_32990 [Streptomyces sp. NPDC001940]
MNPNWAIALVLIGISGAIFCALRVRRALRECDQIVAAAPFHTDPPRIETRPGSNADLLLDAYLAYHGADALDQLLDAIDQHRKGEL